MTPLTDVQVAFRRATTADVQAIVALVEAAYRGEASRMGWTTEADLLGGRRTGADEVTDVLSRPDSYVLALEYDGTLFACCHVERRGRSAYVGMVAVRPDSQNSGLGRRLLAEAERRAVADWQVRSMNMMVIAQRRELIAWYERLGYRRTGTTASFPYGDPRFGLPRRPDLRFEELSKPIDLDQPTNRR